MPTCACLSRMWAATDGDEGPASGRKKKKVKVGGGMRKTRGMIADKSKGPKAFRCVPGDGRTAASLAKTYSRVQGIRCALTSAGKPALSIPLPRGW